MNEWFKKLVEFLKGNPNASEEEIKKGVGEPPKEDKKDGSQDKGAAFGGINIAALPPEIAAVIKETTDLNKTLAAQVESLNKSLAEQKQASEMTTKAINDEREKTRVQKRSEWLEKYKKEGKIAPQNEEEIKKWSELYDKDEAAADFAISKIQATKTDARSGFSAQGKDGAGKGDGKSENLIEDAKSELAARFDF